MQKNAKNMLAEVLSTLSTHQQPLHSREKLLQARMRRIQLARSQNLLEHSSGLKNYTTHDGNTSEQPNISIKMSQHTASNQNINWIKYNILVGIYKNWLRLAPYIIHLLQKDEKSKSKFNQVISHFKQKEKNVRYILKKDFNTPQIEQNNSLSNTKGQMIPNKKLDQNCQKLFQEYKIIKKQISSLTPWLQRNINLEKQNDEVHNFFSKRQKLQSSHQIFKQTGHLKRANFISLKKIQLEAHQIEDLVQSRFKVLEQLQKCFDQVPKNLQLINNPLIELSKINEQNKQIQSQNQGILGKQQCLQLFDKMKKKIKQIRNDCNSVTNKSQQKENLQILKTASASPNVLGLQNSDDERSFLALHSAEKYKTRNSFRPSKILNYFQKNDIQTKRQSIRKKPVNFESSIQQLQPIYFGDLLQNGITNIANSPQNTNPFVTKSKQRIKLLKKTIPLNKMMAEIKEQQKKKKIQRKQSSTAHQYQQDNLENEKGSSNSLYFKSNYLIKYKSKKHFQYAFHDKMYKNRPSKDEIEVIRNKTIQQQRISKSQDLDLIAESIDNESFQYVLKSKTRTKKFRKAKNSLIRYNGGRKSSSKDSDSYRQAKKKNSMLKKLHQKKQYANNSKRSSNLPYKIQYNYKFNDQQLNFKRKKIIDIHRYAIQDDRFEKEENIIRKKQIIINILKKMIEEGVLQNIDQEKRKIVQELIQKQCPDDYLLADFFDYEKLNKIKKVRRQAFFITNQNMNKQKSFYEYLNKLKHQLLENTFDPEQLISINPNFRNRRDSKAYMDLTYNKKWKNQDQLSQSNKILNKNQNLYLQLVDRFINEFQKNRYELIQKKI